MTAEMSAELNRALARILGDDYEQAMRRRDGVARQAYWQAPDGWMIIRTTTAVQGGPHDGKWVVQLMRPIGPGARSGKAESFRETYRRAYATRKSMNARARKLWNQHGGTLDLT